MERKGNRWTSKRLAMWGDGEEGDGRINIFLLFLATSYQETEVWVLRLWRLALRLFDVLVENIDTHLQ